MTLYKRREKFGGFSVKVGIAFSKVGLKPNHWTLLTLIPTFIALWFLIKEAFLPAALFFIIASFLDMVDGAVARVTGTVSKLGAYLDTVVDRYVEIIILFGLLFASLPGLYLPAYAWVFLVMVGGLLTTYVKAAAKEKNLTGDQELKGGILERAERLLILFVGILLAAIQPIYLTYVLIVLAALANISALQRIWIAVKMAKG